jgi:hypothetical protein
MNRKTSSWATALKQIFNPPLRKRKQKRRSPKLSLETLGDRIVPATLLATNTADSLAFTPGTLSGSLRGAIDFANAGTDASYTIQLNAAATYTLSLANTAGQENLNQTGDLDIFSATTKTYIFTTNGPAATIDANFIDRVFQIVGSNVTVKFQNVMLENGKAQDDGTAAALPGSTDAFGGAILNQGGTIDFTNAVVASNAAVGANGANGTAGTLAAPNGGNGTDGKSAFGGAVYSTAGTITLTNTVVENNGVTAGNGGSGGAGYANTATGQSVGNGGNGGNGGKKAGGAFFSVAGNLVINSGSLVQNNLAYSGGIGGIGGAGGARAFDSGNGGNGGNGGNSGTAFGGAIFSTAGNVTVDNGSKVQNNEAYAQGAGDGGAGGAAGVSGDAGGNGGIGGAGSASGGGGIWVVTGNVTLDHGSTVFSNSAYGGFGGLGGSGGANTKPVGSGGNGGAGGNGGSATGGGIFVRTGNVEIDNASSVNSNTVRGSVGQTGGSGGTAGTAEGNGGNGGAGGNGGSGSGGGIFVTTGNVTVDQGSLVNHNKAEGQAGREGGNGAHGGASGGLGGNGGDAGNGGSGSGGGIFVTSGDVTVDNVSFINNNVASGGVGLAGGAAGNGFSGGGNGGAGGIGGSATGGGILVTTGGVTINHGSSVDDNKASAFSGGNGGAAGNGMGAGGNGGAGGAGGIGGDGAGGGVWINSGNVTIDNSSEVGNNDASGAEGGFGAAGGSAVSGNGGAGGDGGAGGSGQGGGIWSGGGNVTLDHSASVKSNLAVGSEAGGGADGGDGSVFGGAGGAGGAGGSGSGGGIFATGGTVTVQGQAAIIKNDADGARGNSGGNGGDAAKTSGLGGAGGVGGAGGSGFGGGVWIGTGAIVVTGSADVYSNSAAGGSGFGGGNGGNGGGAGNDIGGAGGVGGAGGSGAGGGIYAVSANVTVDVKATIKDNQARGGEGGGGGTGGGGDMSGLGGAGGAGGSGSGGGIFAGTGAVVLQGAAQIIGNFVSGAAGGDGGGDAAGGDGGAGGDVLGGGVYIGGSLSMNDGNVSNNTAKNAGNGGAGGAGTGSNGSNGGNGGNSLGGGVYVATGATAVSIKDSSIAFNTAESGGAGGAAGGGVQGNGGNVFGGGLYNASASALISNSTVLGNMATDAGAGAAVGLAQGGGIYNTGTLTLHSSTIGGDNVSDDVGGGISNTGTLTLVSTIVANNTSTNTTQSDLADTGTTTASFSLIQTTAGNTVAATNGNIIGADPDLAAAIFDSTTGTWFENLKFGSVAINSGSNPDNVLNDQLGHSTASDGSFINPPTVNFPNNSHVRVQGLHADMGAIESPSTIPYTAIADAKGNVQIINSSTGQVIRTFRPFDTAASRYVGLMSVALGDMNGDGVPDLIVATRGSRAGKVKVFDGATLLNTANTVLPTDAFLVKFPVDGYKQGLTVASADLNGDGFADLIVATRKTIIHGVVTPGKVLAFSGNGGASLGSTAPFGAHYNGGIYVAAETGGHVLVSAANKSLVRIFNVSGGTFTQVGSDINPLGAGTVINAINGSGQITAFTTNGGATPEFAVGDLNHATGAVTINVYTAAGAPASPASFVAAASGARFFGMGAVNVNQDGNDQLLLAILPDANNTITVTNPDGSTGTTLPSLITLRGQVALAGA